MSLAFIFLFLLFIVDAWASNLWKDSHDAVADVSRLYNGENLLYFVHGSVKFNMETVSNITQFFEIAARNVFCFSISEIARPSVVYEQLGSPSTQPKLVVLNDVHLIDDSNRKSLDLIFRFTDNSGEYKNTILVLFHESSVSSDSSAFTDASWKQHLTKFFNSDSMYINGQALTGRITRAAIDDGVISGSSSMSSKDWCGSLNSRRLNSDISMENSFTNSYPFNWFSVLAMFSIPAGMYFVYRWSVLDGSKSSAELPTVVQPREVRGGSTGSSALKSIKIVSSLSTGSLNSVARSNEVSTPVATPPAASFDGELFRSQYHNNIEGRSGSSYYGEGGISSTDKAAAVARLQLAEETLSVAGSVEGGSNHGSGSKYQSRRRSGSSSSSSTANGKRAALSVFSVANRLSFGDQATGRHTTSTTSSVVMKDDVLAVAAAHNALFSLPSRRLATSPEEDGDISYPSSSPAAVQLGDSVSPTPERDISKIHVTIDETIAPVRIRGRRKTAPTSQQDEEEQQQTTSPSLGGTRRVTRSQDMTTRSGTVLSGSSGVGSGVRRGRARSDSSNKRASARLIDGL